jgi:hypothetical protein
VSLVIYSDFDVLGKVSGYFLQLPSEGSYKSHPLAPKTDFPLSYMKSMALKNRGVFPKQNKMVVAQLVSAMPLVSISMDPRSSLAHP